MESYTYVCMLKVLFVEKSKKKLEIYKKKRIYLKKKAISGHAEVSEPFMTI